MSINYLGKSYPVKINIIKTFTGVISNIKRFVPRTVLLSLTVFYISRYWLGSDKESIVLWEFALIDRKVKLKTAGSISQFEVCLLQLKLRRMRSF